MGLSGLCGCGTTCVATPLFKYGIDVLEENTNIRGHAFPKNLCSLVNLPFPKMALYGM
jgi:hypothetical protein